MDTQELVKFCTEIIKLKEQLKCPICLEIIEETAELHCSHRFCRNCYNTHKHSNVKWKTCPICKTIIHRRSPVHKDEFADKLGKKIATIVNRIERAKQCTIEELVHYDGEPLIRKTKSNSKIEKTVKPQQPTTSAARKLPIKKNLEVTLKTLNPSKLNNPSTSKEDAFDKLMATPQKLTLNKKGTTMKYKRKKKDEQEDSYKILDFDNVSTKNAVLAWLNDNRNKFERLTQTQFLSCESKEVPNLELDSVSQGHPVKSETSEKLVARKKRARSLDLDLDKSIKERSYLSDLGLVDNYDIEEVYTEAALKIAAENALLNIIEDECLDKIENDLQKNRPKSKLKEQHTTQSSHSGWERIEKISKKKKSPKQLNITLQSVDSTDGKKGFGRILRNKTNKENVIENVTDSSKIGLNANSSVDMKTIPKKVTDPVNEAVPQVCIKDDHLPTGDLENEVIMSNISQSSNVENDTQANKQEPKIVIITDIAIHNPPVDTKEVSGEVDKDLEMDVDPYLVPTQMLDGSKEKPIPPQVDHTPYFLPTQKLVDSKEKPVPLQNDQDMESALDGSDLHNSFPDLNDFSDVMSRLYSYVGSINDNKHLTKRHIENILKYLEKLTDLHEVSRQKASEDFGVQTEIKYCNVGIQATDFCSITNLSEVSRQPKQDSDKVEILSIKSIHNDDFSVTLDLVNYETQELINQSKEKSHKDIRNEVSTGANSIESEIRKSSLTSSFVTKSQEITLSKVSQQLQKDSDNLQDNAKEDTNIKPIKIKPSEHQANTLDLVVDDTQDIFKQYVTNVKENCVLSRKDIPNETELEGSTPEIKKTANTEEKHTATTLYVASQQAQREPGKVQDNGFKKNDDFAGTLELLDFDTQVIVNQCLKVKNREENDTFQRQEVPDEKRFKAGTSKNRSQKEINRPLDPKEEENILICSLKSDGKNKNDNKNASKRLLSDSDTSDVVVPKRRCNRFIRDDLSIEFDTEKSLKSSFVKELSFETDDEENEEYLDNILKKIGNGGSDNNPALPSTRDDKLDEVGDKMIEEIKRNIVKRTENNTSTSSSYKTASPTVPNDFDDDNLFLNTNNLSKMDNDIRLHTDDKDIQLHRDEIGHLMDKDNQLHTDQIGHLMDKDIRLHRYEIGHSMDKDIQLHRDEIGHSETSDVIAETESLEPLPKKIKLRKLNIGFTDLKNEEVAAFSQKETMKNCTSPQKSNKGTFCPELEDSSDDACFENIEVDEELQRGSVNANLPKSNVEDMFSDDDVVEMTPQKNRSFFEKRSQSKANSSIQIPPLDNIDNTLGEDFDFDFLPLAPPPGFDDEDEETSLDQNITVVNMHTPDKKLHTPNNKNVDIDTPCNPTRRRKVTHSTPITQARTEVESIMFSPILEENGSIETAHNSPRKLVEDEIHLSPVPQEKIIFSSQNTPRKPDVAEEIHLSPVPQEKIIFSSQNTPRKPDVADKFNLSPVPLEKSISSVQNTPKMPDIAEQIHFSPFSQEKSIFSVQNSPKIPDVADKFKLSPRPQEKNIFEHAYNSSNTIITVNTTDIPPKQNILTSNPKQKSILNYLRSSQGSNSDPKQKPCVTCTRLSKDQVERISLLTNKKLITFRSKFCDSVTHLIVKLDENKRINEYTMKLVSAVASGLWILDFEWVEECLKNNAIVSEEPFEALDDTGQFGPKMARLTKNENPLFRNYQFHCTRPMHSTTPEELEDVIHKLGGTTVKSLESFKSDPQKINLIITEGIQTQDFELFQRWREKYEMVTVDIEWLSRSVGRYKVISLRPYISCSDGRLDDLGYPSYLTSATSYSSSAQT